MDFGLEWHQEELREVARRFLAEHCTHERLRAAEDSPEGFETATHRQIGELGWLDLAVRCAQPQSDEDLIDLIVLYEEFGRAAFPGPHFISSVLAAALIGTLDGEARQPLLDAIGTGEQVVTVALYEETADYDAGSVELQATTNGDGLVLDGRKLFVPYASAADQILVLARTGEPATDLTWVLVPSDAAGVRITPLATMSTDRLHEVTFARVAVAPEALVGELGSGWEAFRRVLPRVKVIQAAELVGLADAAFESALEYSKVRIAFGRPIGAFQAIQHKVADMLADRDGARFMVYQAACLLNAGRDQEAPVTMAKAFASVAARHVTKDAHQIWGGHGWVKENPLNFYYRRAKAIELALGDVNEEFALVGDQLGL